MPTESSFFQPHEEAAALVRGKPAVTRDVFDKLLPELRGRAFTVTGLDGLGVVERVRDEIATYSRGQDEEGNPITWESAKAKVVEILDGSNFGPEAAERRATLLLRTHGFQAYQAANWRVAQEDEDTTHLQYLATEDSHVRDSHLALNGLILPKSDPFWDKHYPPWEWGCRCRVRPMNSDLVDEERALDHQRNPEDRLVIEGPRLQQLRYGQVIRGELRDRDGRTVGMGSHDVTAPSEKPGGREAYRWNPGDLRLDSGQVLGRYEPAEAQLFNDWARKTALAPGYTVQDWLAGEVIPRHMADPVGQSGSARTIGLGIFAPAGKALSRQGMNEALRTLERGNVQRSLAGPDVTFGQIAHGHLSGKTDQRARFLPAALATVQDPQEIWQIGLRRYYIRVTVGADGAQHGMVVITTRQGERLEEAVTWMPKLPHALEAFRVGKLIFRK